MRFGWIVLGVFLLASSLPAAGLQWKQQFFLDEAKSQLTLLDFAMPSAQRGIAVGYRIGPKKQQPVAVLTSDSGAHWTVASLPANPVSIFFLNDSLGWLVSEDGIFQTLESGRSWKKVSKKANIWRVHFTSPQHGWAIGSPKAVWETNDGGVTWTLLPTAAKLPGNPGVSMFTQIAFLNEREGVIIGSNRAIRTMDPLYPDGNRPFSAARRETPHLMLSLETHDGGQAWTPSSASVFGDVTALELGKDGRGLAIFRYYDQFPHASELVGIGLKNGKSTPILQPTDQVLTDVRILPDGSAFLAGVVRRGQSNLSPIPTAVRIARSNDLRLWVDMPVDYRAEATRVLLGGPDAKHLWAVTDTGMILHLEEASTAP